MDVGLVCDACTALTPIGVPECTRCGAAVALDPRASRGAARADDASGVSCGRCGLEVTPGTRFCPNCGAKIAGAASFEVETRVGPPRGLNSPAALDPPSPLTQKPGRSTLFMGGVHQTARAKLTLIRGDGEDGVSFTLAGRDHLAGRGDCPISFPDDPFLSPTHANFIYANNQLVVRDEGSLNGVFVRIGKPVELAPDATVLVGEQVLTVRPAPQPEDLPDTEGTYYSASMLRPATMEIRQHLRGGAIGWVFRPVADIVRLGREGNDINFPDDPFISGKHAELRYANGVITISDLGSRNGTFVRIAGEKVLGHGDYVFLGQQLLRVEIV